MNTETRMGTIKALDRQDAIDKMKELGERKVCMFMTTMDRRPIPVRPMAVQQVCEHGNFWFLSSRTSAKDQQLRKDPQVQLLFADASNAEFMSVLGTAEEIDDQQKKLDLWNPIAKAWFPNGVEDPDLTVIKVTTTDAQYWDTEHGKLVSMIKILGAVVTGEPADGGVQGKLHVR
ncbi:MAG: pyridoxamine 5'-phosphate oxidase family protein [Flavobacteriales bacterium]|nr:pyridoxamine 5'-phosphate oxidase family protein [Flavobacteriales bacterium]